MENMRIRTTEFQVNCPFKNLKFKTDIIPKAVQSYWITVLFTFTGPVKTAKYQLLLIFFPDFSPNIMMLQLSPEEWRFEVRLHVLQPNGQKSTQNKMMQFTKLSMCVLTYESSIYIPYCFGMVLTSLFSDRGSSEGGPGLWRLPQRSGI